ncbi:NAD-dependent epimerase/dehydratase family protein [Phreatobacter stygius]|uniref:SDR family oxidoreductase n=1 Tax=Phreatobacter stygius TaxID=1940610 RepID=A0A4D7B3Y4_9HYPH|nr:SDR family oxidoreductase [Phreatobacter stygius]QCI65955.1 SDR family oxidoreductase [Phreatobacter stygius]
MRVLVTGGKGFLGAWIIRRLLKQGLAVRIFDVAEDRGLVEAIGGIRAGEVEWHVGDIVTGEDVLTAAAGCHAIVHLAGVLTPACQAHPVRGAEINLIGTLNVFEAALRHGISRVVYTSSAGVYGPDDGLTPRPTTHYGTFKLACEGSARAYLADHGLASIGFRPFIVYGPGRETGLTAGPSLACRAAARGESYRIPYSGSAGLVFVDDVAAAYESAVLRDPAGAHVFNLVGTTVSNDDVVAAIRRVVASADITAGGPALPIAADVDPGAIAAVLPGLPQTSLTDGIALTVDFYRQGGRL